MNKTVAFASILLASSALTQAEDFTTWRISVDQLSFDSAKTQPSGVSDTSSGLGLAIDIKKGFMVGGFGMYAGSLSDDNQFSQTVEDQYGNISEADSTVSAISFFGEIGASYNAANIAYLDLVSGYQTMSIDRSISNCSDCDSDDIPVDGGLYVKPRVKVALGEKFLLSASYTSYLSGDIKSGLLIGFEGRF